MDRIEVQELVKIVQFQTQLSIGDIAAEIGCSRDHFVRVKSKSGLNGLAEGIRRKFEKEIADFKAHFGKSNKKESEPLNATPGAHPNEAFFLPDSAELSYIRRTVFDAYQSLNGLEITLKSILRSLAELEKIHYAASKKKLRQPEVKGMLVKIKKLNNKTEARAESRKRNLG